MSISGKLDEWVVTFAQINNDVDQTPASGTLNGATASNYDSIPVRGARTISCQVKDVADASTSLDINVKASMDGGTTWDTTSFNWTSFNMDTSADTDSVGSFAISPGPTHIRFRADENSTQNSTPVIYMAVTWDD